MTTTLQSLKNNPYVIIEDVKQDPPWRGYLSKYADESTVDEFLIWAKHNKKTIAEFINKTIEHIKAGDEVSAITITDELNINHNRSRLLSIVCMAISKECRGYFSIRETKKAA